MNRRAWLAALAAAGPMSRMSSASERRGPPSQGAAGGLALTDFQPRSMLEVPETRVPRARFPVIDFHTHLGSSAAGVAGVAHGGERKFRAPASELLPVMDRVNLRVTLTGSSPRSVHS